MKNQVLNLSNEQVRRDLANQYKPLLYKIARQWIGKLPIEFDDIFGYAQEGFVYSMNTYKEGTSQSFQQYAAWCIRNYILTGANEEGYTVKFSAYNQKKAKERGESTFIIQSINEYDDMDEDRNSVLGVDVPDYENNIETIYTDLYKLIESKFSVRDIDIFYSFYGLNGYESVKGKDLAEKYNLSPASITLICKKIVKYISNSPIKERLRCIL